MAEGYIALKLFGFRLKQPEIESLLMETERFKTNLADIMCPSCESKTLKLVNYVQGPTGWSSTFFCTSCDTRGELNSDGFRVELTEKIIEELPEEAMKPKHKKGIEK